MTFNYDYNRYGYIYLIKNKSQTFEKSKEFKQDVENQLGRKIKMLMSDRGGECLTCESYLLVKMTKSPFTGTYERGE